MKKKFFASMALAAVAAVAVIGVSCQKDDGLGDLLDLDMAQIIMMTPAQQAIFDEATKRIDKYISFDADARQYVMGTGLSAGKVGLSERFFAYFKQNFEVTNAQLKQLQGKGLVAVEVSKNCLKIFNPEDGFDILTKGGAGRSFGDIEEGGINDVETYWFGFVVKISNNTLKYMLAGSSVTGTVTSFFPALPAQVISKVCYYLDVALATGIVAYPNGVEIGVGTDGCYMKKQ